MHALDFTTGKAGIAYTGEVPWHGLGQRLEPGADLITWQQQAGLDWHALIAGVKYDRMIVDVDGVEKPALTESKKNKVIYRSDTGDVLSVMSDRYQPVQPKQIIEFYRDLTEKYGFELETAGSLKDGKRVWALANTKNVTTLRGDDTVKGYLLLATSYDGSASTQARFTPVRVVCNNTFTAAIEGAADVVVPHSTTFDADKVKMDLKVGEAWERFSQAATSMTNRIVSKDEAVRFFLDTYYGLTTTDEIRQFQEDDKTAKSAEKFIQRMTNELFNSPGANLASARGTLWGLMNAVTHDVDFSIPARSQENRLNSAWFGKGNGIKNRAWNAAGKLLAA